MKESKSQKERKYKRKKKGSLSGSLKIIA